MAQCEIVAASMFSYRGSRLATHEDGTFYPFLNLYTIISFFYLTKHSFNCAVLIRAPRIRCSRPFNKHAILARLILYSSSIQFYTKNTLTFLCIYISVEVIFKAMHAFIKSINLDYKRYIQLYFFYVCYFSIGSFIPMDTKNWAN